MLEHRLDRHDRSQFELKLNYRIDPEVPNQQYSVEAFVFVPRVLSITRQSYGKSRFYEDTATFIRMTTPRVALAGLADDELSARWMKSLRTEVDSSLSGINPTGEAAIRSLKLLGCIVKSGLRDETQDLLRRLKETLGQGQFPGAVGHASRWINEFTDHLEGAITRLRAEGQRCEHTQVPEALREAWCAVDEYVSMKAEESLTRILAQVKEWLTEEPDHEIGLALERLSDLAVFEYHHRRGRGYASYASDNSRNEYLPHRRHVLKRFVSSVLYLDVRESEVGNVANNMIGMAAAAAAMFFATIAILLIQSQWGNDLSTAFVAAMVISYVVKDRIKEHGKRILGKRLSSLLPDHRLDIKASDTEETIGWCKELFQVTDAKDVEQAIYIARHADHMTQEALEGRPETVLCYSKEVELSSTALSKQIRGASGLSDIIRFNIWRLMGRMDDPWEIYQYVNPKTRNVDEVKCARVYHINIVLRLTRSDGEAHVEHVRVVANRKGILRVGEETLI